MTWCNECFTGKNDLHFTACAYHRALRLIEQPSFSSHISCTEINTLRALTSYQLPTTSCPNIFRMLRKLLNLQKSRSQNYSSDSSNTRLLEPTLATETAEVVKLPEAVPEAFPIQRMLQVLQQNGDYTDAFNFLVAFPRFQTQVVIIKDHFEQSRFYNLSQTGAPTISIWDYDKLVRQCTAQTNQYSLKIFAYEHAEEKLNTKEFNESRNCLYARHLDENSLVMMRSFYKGESTAAMGTMTTHLSRANAWQPCAYTTRRDEFPKNWIIFDRKIDRLLDSTVLGLVERWDSNKFNPPLVSSTRRYESCLTVAEKERRTLVLQTENYNTLDLEPVYLPLVHKAIVHLNGPTDGYRSPTFVCQLPHLDDFYIKYYACKHPLIDRQYTTSTSDHIGNSNSGRSNAVFTMVNESWSPDQPRKNDCYHHSPQHTHLDDMDATGKYMHFLANFGIITLKGIADDFLTRSALHKMKELYWERDTTPSTNTDSKAINTFAPELEKLTLCSEVSTKAGPTPIFECPKLRSLKLVSLVGSDTKWDLTCLLDEVLPTYLANVAFNGFWWLKARDEPMAMTSDDLAFVAHKVENLSVKGYRPDFVLSQSGKDVSFRYFYPKLKDLTIDISRIPLCSSVMAPSPDKCMLMVDFFNASFPVIEAISLVIPYGGSTGAVPQAKTLSLFIPPSVTQVQVSSSWFSNGRVLEINGLRVDQGKRDGVLETSRTGRQWKRSKLMKDKFEFARVVILEEWEDCCVK